MKRLFLLLLPIMITVWITGCAKKPAPSEPVPVPMTEAYLLKHMQVTFEDDNLSLSIVPRTIHSQPRFMDGNATLSTTFDAEITLDGHGEISQIKPPKYLLLFSMRADAWGGFTSAIDTAGKHHVVVPYTSYIRKGVYYDNFYITLSRPWLETAKNAETELLFLGSKSEMSVTIPAVYPRALLNYIDAGSFLPDHNTSTTASE
jgi:hypothetical protein